LNIFKPFWPYLRPHRRRIVLGIILILLSQVVSTGIPYMLKLVVDDVEAGLSISDRSTVFTQIALYAGAILLMALVQMGLQMVMRWHLQAMSRYVENDIREKYVRHLMRLSLNYFNRTPTGDLMSRATNDINAVRMFLGFGVRMLFDGGIGLVLSLGVMCIIDWELALWVLAPMPFLALSMNRVASSINSGFREVQEQFANIAARVQENLSGVRLVKAYVQRDGETAAFDKLNRRYLDRNKRLIRIESVIRPLSFLLSGSSLLLTIWLGGEKVLSGQISLGDLVAFNGYLTKLIFPILLFGWMVDRYQRGIASMRRIDAVIEEIPDIEDADDVVETDTIRGEVEFRSLKFAYQGTEVLRDINLKIPAGSTLALVGRVGTGKTTLARLIPRLIQAGEGQVLIDGIPVEKIPLQVLRKHIGVVPQDSFLFSDTLRENIALGVADATDEDIEWAMEASQLADDLSDFPHGLKTVVGERGVTLSGGQKQRTALARAVIRRPSILILDDAMASVDTHTEEEILKRLKAVMAERTTILIAHRISTVMHADQIVVLEDGRIAESGTHDELLAIGGIYTEMYKRQQLHHELSEI
jgi:ATP-binding cassette subfamily B multidrug efflux pump